MSYVPSRLLDFLVQVLDGRIVAGKGVTVYDGLDLVLASCARRPCSVLALIRALALGAAASMEDAVDADAHFE
jgi:hypothetical protein